MSDSVFQSDGKKEARGPRRIRREQERVARLNHLAEMGTLAAGLAHELKNPLSTMKLNLQLMEEDLAGLAGAERSRQRVATLRKEADRLSQTLNDFLQFAGRIELRPAPINVNQLLQELIDFIHPQAQAAKVRVLTSLTDENPMCSIDSNLMKQAILNLLLNAQQAMPSGGELLIRTQVGKGSVFIDIADTGTGIAKEHLPRIFDAYFTTKKGGTGLGLPTTRRIIEEHRGSITVTSEPGRGTNFRVELPIAESGGKSAVGSAQ
jgi:signal transduction histidine kinase